MRPLHSYHIHKCTTGISCRRMIEATIGQPHHEFSRFICQLALPTGALSSDTTASDVESPSPNFQVAGIQTASLSIWLSLAVCLTPVPTRHSVTHSLNFHTLQRTKPLTLSTRGSGGFIGSWWWSCKQGYVSDPQPPSHLLFSFHFPRGSRRMRFSPWFLQRPFLLCCPKYTSNLKPVSRLPDQWFSRCGLWTRSMSIPWKLVRHASSWASPQTSMGPVIRIQMPST